MHGNCAFRERKLSAKEIRAALQAVKYAGALSLTLGGFFALIGLFSLLNYLCDLTLIGPGLAQITLSLFYTAVIETIYVILLFRIKRGIDSFK